MSIRAILSASLLGLACQAVEPVEQVEPVERVEPVEPALASKVECELDSPPRGLVDLHEQLPSVQIVAGYHRADNFTGAPLPGYAAAGAWFERDAARSLAQAAEDLAEHDLGLVVYDAYRPRRASEAMVAWADARGREDLLADGWVAARSAHNRGQAIDLGLYRLADGQPLDMGSAWDHFGPTSFLRGVDGAALAHRLRLRGAMVRAGFVPYNREWWHFTWVGEAGPALDAPYRCRPTQP